MNEDNLRERINKEIRKIKSMNREQKISYFKTYYMWKSLAILIAIILVVLFIKDTMFQKEAVSSGIAFNVELSEEQYHKLTDEYLENFGYDSDKYMANVARDNLFYDTAQKMDEYSNMMALQAQIAAGEIFYLMIDKRLMEEMASAGIYSSLDEVLDKETIDYLHSKDAVCSVTDPDYGEVIVAIDLSKIGFFESDREGYLIYTVACPSKDYAESFLRYLME